MIKNLKSKLRSILFFDQNNKVSIQISLKNEIDNIKNQVRKFMPDNLLLHGYKVYSQCDEDGIINEIFKRIGTKNKIFFEIGCSDGLENNTHTLIHQGWSGVWLDGDEKKINFIKNELGEFPQQRLSLISNLVFKDNVETLIQKGLKEINYNQEEIDFFSIDIDGNDLHILNSIERLKPRVFCVEYNAKFPLPIKTNISYDPNHIWGADDYHGASLQSFIEFFQKKNYSLVCCNIAGTNAFFIKNSEIQQIELYEPEFLYQPSRYHLINLESGHKATLKFLKSNIFPEKGL